ncbi:hypothetical protein ACOSP7_020863 [Xanthoceras sorbifolium]
MVNVVATESETEGRNKVTESEIESNLEGKLNPRRVNMRGLNDSWVAALEGHRNILNKRNLKADQILNDRHNVNHGANVEDAALIGRILTKPSGA